MEFHADGLKLLEGVFDKAGSVLAVAFAVLVGEGSHGAKRPVLARADIASILLMREYEKRDNEA